MPRAPRQLAVLVLPLLIALAVAAQDDRSQPELSTIVQKVEQAQLAVRDNARPYVVTRDYQFYEGQEKQQPDSEVTAEISYLPPSTKEFSIQEARGSGRGERVVRKVLEHEQQMSSSWRDSAITDENYKFSLLGEEALNGRRCFILGLEPRRESKELLKGRAWVDAETYRIHRIVGEPAKSPSWWIKHLQVTLQFANVEGMWLQTATHADADVRMFGHHILTSRDVSCRTGALDASAKRQPRRPQRDLATGILIVR